MRRLSRFLPPLLVIFVIDLIITIVTNSSRPSMVSIIANAMTGLRLKW